MFIRLEKSEVYSIVGKNGRDEPIGDIYIKNEHISHIDGNVVVAGDFVFVCSQTGISKVLNAIGMGAE